jgi:serine/threonine-protein kinase
MQKIRLDRYTPPRKVRRDVPPALERILARCLEKNPAHRYPSTGALVSDLAEFLSHTGVLSHEARLIDYLADVGMIAESRAREMLGPAASVWLRSAASRVSIRSLALVQAAFGVAVLGVLLVGENSRPRNDPTEASSLLGPRAVGVNDVGFLRVVARPWAQISIDGVVVETTPTVQPFRLAPGAHYVRLTNPAFVTEDRTVQIGRGSTVWIDVEMAPAGAGPSR